MIAHTKIITLIATPRACINVVWRTLSVCPQVHTPGRLPLNIQGSTSDAPRVPLASNP